MPDIAMLVEISNETMQSKNLREQVVIIPGRPLYGRVTDGGKGPINSWLEGYGCPSGDTVVRAVGARITEKDQEAIDSKGWSPVLAQKLLAACNKVPQSSHSADPKSFVERMQKTVDTQSSVLESFVHDGRKRKSKAATPLALESPIETGIEKSIETQDIRVPDLPMETVTVTVEPRVEPRVEDQAVEAPSALVTVPDISLGKAYVKRVLAGGVTDLQMLDYADQLGDNVLLLGPTGSGKTSLPIAWASINKRKCYSISGNQALEPSQLFGKHIPYGSGFAWCDGPVTTLVREGGVLIIDEINLISSKILTVLYPLLDSRREITLLDHSGETIKAHKDLLIVATGNPGYVGTGVLSEAMLDRWPHRWDWGYDDSVERRLVKSKSLRELFRKIRDHGEVETPMSTRLMIEFERMAAGLGWEYASMNMLNRIQDSEERSAIKLLLGTFEHNIQVDLGLAQEAEAPEPEEKTDEVPKMGPWEEAEVG